MEPWIVRMCREVLRRRVLACVSVLLAGVMFLFASARYIQNFLAGPYALQPHELSQITDVEKTPRYFVSVQVEKVFDTGIQEITTTTRNGTEEGRYVSGGYYAVLVGGRFLIV